MESSRRPEKFYALKTSRYASASCSWVLLGRWSSTKNFGLPFETTSIVFLIFINHFARTSHCHRATSSGQEAKDGLPKYRGVLFPPTAPYSAQCFHDGARPRVAVIYGRPRC